MPFIVRYPKMVKPKTVTKALINNADFVPNIIDFADQSAPSSMQGKSFMNVLKGRSDKHRKSSFYAFYSGGIPNHYGIRTERYKLIVWPESKEKDLFDLQKDPHELKNVYNDSTYAAVVKNMEAELKAAIKEVDISSDQLPGNRKAAKKTQDAEPKLKKQKKQRTKKNKKNIGLNRFAVVLPWSYL